MSCSGMVITWDCQFCGLFFNFVERTVLRSPLKNRQAVYGVPYASTARDLVASHGMNVFEAVVPKSSACVAIVAFLMILQTRCNFGATSWMSYMILNLWVRSVTGLRERLPLHTVVPSVHDCHDTFAMMNGISTSPWLNICACLAGWGVDVSHVGIFCPETVMPTRILAGAAHLDWV